MRWRGERHRNKPRPGGAQDSSAQHLGLQHLTLAHLPCYSLPSRSPHSSIVTPWQVDLALNLAGQAAHCPEYTSRAKLHFIRHNLPGATRSGLVFSMSVWQMTAQGRVL